MVYEPFLLFVLYLRFTLKNVLVNLQGLRVCLQYVNFFADFPSCSFALLLLPLASCMSIKHDDGVEPVCT